MTRRRRATALATPRWIRSGGRHARRSGCPTRQNPIGIRRRRRRRKPSGRRTANRVSRSAWQPARDGAAAADRRRCRSSAARCRLRPGPAARSDRGSGSRRRRDRRSRSNRSRSDRPTRRIRGRLFRAAATARRPARNGGEWSGCRSRFCRRGGGPPDISPEHCRRRSYISAVAPIDGAKTAFSMLVPSEQREGVREGVMDKDAPLRLTQPRSWKRGAAAWPIR